jgi:hypothetical protein
MRRPQIRAVQDRVLGVYDGEIRIEEFGGVFPGEVRGCGVSGGGVERFLEVGLDEVGLAADFVVGVGEEIEDYGEGEHGVDACVASRWDVQGG